MNSCGPGSYVEVGRVGRMENATEVTAAGIARLAEGPDGPRSAAGGDGTPTSSRWAAPRPALLRARRGRGAAARRAKARRGPALRERVWQRSLAGHCGPGHRAAARRKAVLLLVHDRSTEWLALNGESDDRLLAERLPAALEGASSPPLRTGPRARPPPRRQPPCSSVPRVARRRRARRRPRHPPRLRVPARPPPDANPRQYTTPPGPAALMAALAGPADTASTRPAAPAQFLLRAVRHRPARGPAPTGQGSKCPTSRRHRPAPALDDPGSTPAAHPSATAAADTLRGDACRRRAG